jgi:hypothetical protein
VPETLDIGFCCEKVLIQILSQTPSLGALAPKHADEDTDSQNARIVVKAEAVYPEAPNPRDPQRNVRRIEMRAQIRASLGQMTAPALHAAYGEMCQIIENMDGPTYAAIPALALFTYLVPKLDLENSRENDEQRRRLMKTFSFLAILKNTIPLP